MESNISKDHIALEAMKILLKETMFDNTSICGRVKRFFCKGSKMTSMTNAQDVAKMAYDYADAMVAERERRNNEED